MPTLHSKLLVATALTASSIGIGHHIVSGQSAGSGEPVFVPITPCRLLDTRPATALNTGPRNTPIGAA